MRKSLLSCLLLAPGLVHAQAPITYTIKGNVGKLTAPAKIYMLRGTQLLDSAAVKNGAFELKGTTDIPKEAELVVQPTGRLRNAVEASGAKDKRRLFLEQGTILVKSPDSLKNATLAGGPATADYQRLEKSLEPVQRQQKAMQAEFRKLTPEQMQTPEFAARAQTLGQALFQEYARSYMAFVKANPNSWVSLDVLSTTRMMSPPKYHEVAPLYEAFSPTLKNTQPGREYAQMLAALKATAIGAQAPEFSQTTPDGKTVSLRDYRGKYVLIDFWASWCGPCREENPNVLRAYNAFKGRNFEVLGVSLDDAKGRDKWLKAIKDDAMPWVQVSDLKGWENEAARRYNVQGIPQNFLIDPSGKIVAENLRGEELKTTLATFIK